MRNASRSIVQLVCGCMNFLPLQYEFVRPLPKELEVECALHTKAHVQEIRSDQRIPDEQSRELICKQISALPRNSEIDDSIVMRVCRIIRNEDDPYSRLAYTPHYAYTLARDMIAQRTDEPSHLLACDARAGKYIYVSSYSVDDDQAHEGKEMSTYFPAGTGLARLPRHFVRLACGCVTHAYNWLYVDELPTSLRCACPVHSRQVVIDYNSEDLIALCEVPL